MAKRKDRKGKKKARKGAKRGLPSAVQGLLQYLGGSGANLQPSAAPQRPRATGADAGETLTRYLAAKTQNLEAIRAAALGTSSAAAIEERLMAKRAAEDVEKKVSMLSVGLKESDKDKKKVIKELEEQKTALRNLGRDQLFASLRGAKESGFTESIARGLGMRTPSVGSGNTPDWAGMSVSSEGMQSAEYGGESGASLGGGGGAAAEMYMMNRPLERPIIRDRPRAEPRLPRRQAPATEAKRVQISAADLRAGISSATGLARSRYKLPSSRARYADVQAALGRTAGSSADIIAALKEAGVNVAET
jgi:lambda repressor-like predicted transcriptional regulator